MKVGMSNLEGIKKKDRKTILQKEKEKKREKEQKRKKKKVEIRKAEEEGSLREITVKIGLERIDT